MNINSDKTNTSENDKNNKIIKNIGIKFYDNYWDKNQLYTSKLCISRTSNLIPKSKSDAKFNKTFFRNKNMQRSISLSTINMDKIDIGKSDSTDYSGPRYSHLMEFVNISNQYGFHKLLEGDYKTLIFYHNDSTEYKVIVKDNIVFGKLVNDVLRLLDSFTIDKLIFEHGYRKFAVIPINGVRLDLLRENRSIRKRIY